MDALSGFIKCDKPAGWTSFDVVAKVRATIRDESRREGAGSKVKVGHSGTLDPFATGLMVLAIGPATRSLNELLKADKSYRAELALGATSETGDPDGEITPSQTVSIPSEATVRTVLRGLVGPMEQTPPAYSAIKIAGVRAYQRARRGEAVVIPSRPVKIHSLDLIGFDYPKLEIDCFVSSGTYIRSLAETIGEKLGTGAYLTVLKRLTIGDITLSGALDPRSLSYEQIRADTKPLRELL
jgi:tRNA pseudouridine55 synthase